jgi:hypothetical protein
MFGGGPLASAAGDALVKAGVNLRNAYGATEFVPPTRMVPSRGTPEDWEWFEMREEAPIRWEEQGGGSGLYECVFLVSEFYQVYDLIKSRKRLIDLLDFDDF